MPLKIIKFAVYGLSSDISLETQTPSNQTEFSGIETIVFYNDNNFKEIFINWEPDLVIVIGNLNDYPVINSMKDILKTRLFTLSHDEWEYHGQNVFVEQFFARYISNSLNKNNSYDKVSVYTVTCNTKERINVAYQSLLNQTHQNWEWSIYDDSTDDVTWQIVKDLAKQDARIIINKNNNPSHFSRIGYNKFNAATNCGSEYLIELDHDDAFTNDALEKILLTHKQHPDCGFVYGDWTEMVYESKQEITYGDGFAWGYGSYYQVKHPFLNRDVTVVCAPNVNPLTIRRLWSLFNHPKSWKKSFYMSVGGHNKYLNSADDYELMIRTFLNTKMVHLHHYCYIQYVYEKNTKVSNGGLGWSYHGDILRHVRFIENFYHQKIKNRFDELGLHDWVYNPKTRDCLKDYYAGKKYPQSGDKEQNANLNFKPQ